MSPRQVFERVEMLHILCCYLEATWKYKNPFSWDLHWDGEWGSWETGGVNGPMGEVQVNAAGYSFDSIDYTDVSWQSDTLLFNTMFRLVIAFLSRTKCLNFMAAVTICSDFGAQENKICHWFCFILFYLTWIDGTGCHDLSFWMLSFKPAFSFSFSTLIKRLFSSSLLSAIRVVSSAHLGLFLFLTAIVIPVCDLSSLAFRIMYSAYKLNKQVDNIQPCYIPLPTCNQSLVSCWVLTVASWPEYNFLRR